MDKLKENRRRYELQINNKKHSKQKLKKLQNQLARASARAMERTVK